MFSVSPAIAWLIAGIAVLGAEIFLGTAYLLVVAFAFGATAAGAAVGLDFTMQLVVCAAVLAGGCLSVIAVRRRNAGRKDPSAKLQHLDSGQWVTVDVVGSDGLAVVQYRGAPWVARPEGNEPLTPGRWSRRHAARARPPFLRQISTFFQHIVWSSLMPIEITGFLILSLIIVLVAVVFASQGIKVVPQQTAWVVERLGKFHAVLSPGLNFIIPFIDRVAYRHSLKEIPLDTPSQVCITRDNTQLTVDGVLFFQVTDPQRASYGTSNYIIAVTQLAQTTLRSVVGKMELDKTFEERDLINKSVVSAIDEAALNWGVKVLRYEIKDLTPPAVILQAMQQQITAEREKRAVVAASEGRKLEQINLATGAREAAIAQSEGDKQAEINKAEGQAAATLAIATATAEALRRIAEATQAPGGATAVSLQVAEKYVAAFGELARTNNTLIVPGNMGDLSTMITSAMKIVDGAKNGAAASSGLPSKP